LFIVVVNIVVDATVMKALVNRKVKVADVI